MEYSIITEEGGALQRRFAVSLAKDEVEGLVGEIYAFLAMQAGVDYLTSVPKDALRRRFGDDLDRRVATCLANQCTDRIIGQEGLPAALEPAVEFGEFADDAPFSFEATVFLKPCLELSSYGPVSLPIPDFAVSDEMLERNLQAIVDERARYVTDDKATAVTGDTRNVITLSTTKCGMQVQGLTAGGMVYQLGDGTLPPQVEQELLGMAPGQEKEFSFTVTSKNFLGLDVDETMDARLRVDSIVKKESPEVTDEWVRDNIPGAHSVDGFRSLVRENLAFRARADYDRIKEEAAASALAERLPDEDLPDEYYDYARAGLLQNVSAALAQQGMSTDELFAAQGVSSSQFMVQMRQRARAVVRQGLALDAFARHEGLVADEDDFARALKAIAPGNEDETRKMLEMNGRLYQLAETALRTKARAHLLQHATTRTA